MMLMEPLTDTPNPGVYNKYNVTRNDGKPVDGHEYFVVRVDPGGKHRQAALAAACKFAQEIEDTDPQLSDSMWNRYYPERDHKEMVVVMYDGYYGRGRSLSEAMRNYINTAGIPKKTPKKMGAYKGKDIRVHGIGDVHAQSEIVKLDKEEVMEAFQSELNSRFENMLCDLDKLAKMKDIGPSVERWTQSIADTMGEEYGL
jgi:hypothetical protein